MKITAQTRISDLIEAYPFLTTQLATIDPKFALLKNKAARLTMGKLATVSMAAQVASMAPGELVSAIEKIIATQGEKSTYPSANQAKLEVLKEIIRQMHAGGDADNARRKFNDLIGEIDPSEIKDLEQQLVMEGMPVSEIQNLCELHVGVFKDALGQNDDVVVPAGHPVHTYQMENQRLHDVIERIEKELHTDDGHAFDASRPALLEALGAIASVETHYVRKENQLFPFMEKHGITAPPQVMWAVHDEIRTMIKETRQALASEDEGTIRQRFASLLHAVGEMIFKEEKILFPMVLQSFTDAEWSVIRHGEDELGYILGVSPGQDWQPETMAAKSVADGLLPLSTGKMSLSQINAMLKALPLDLSFVNADDEVMYYSDTKERFFPRSPGVIGRKVQNCHPPKSMHVVQEIVDAFRSGRRDEAAFWINLQGKTLYIRYFAVRDDAGVYLGTLEMTQDITGIQMIEGERRLLDWDADS